MVSAPDEEWTEKYRPVHLKDVVGNERQRVRMLKWGRAWAEGCPIGESCSSGEEIARKKALVLAGPPGIGKTTSALALANDMGWSVIEMNASDTRNADAVRGIALAGAITQGFTEEGDFVRSEEGERKLIILDEADNLSGNADRGGVKAIVDLIKRTSQPVILIVNDLYSLQRRSSFFKKRKGSPVEILVFERPSDSEVEEFLSMVAEKEGLDMERSVIREIAVRAAGDVRGALNDLQSFAYSGASMDDVLSSGIRDRELDMTGALRHLHRSTKISEGISYLRRIDGEPSGTLLWLDELVPMLAGSERSLYESFEHLSMADVYLSRVWRRQQYSLWKYASDEMAASLVLMKDRRPFPSRFFPMWLMAMSRSRNARRIRYSLALKLAKHMHTTTDRVLQDILPAFTALFIRDEEFMDEMIWKLDLDEKEVDFLIEDTAKAKMAVERARHGRTRESRGLVGISDDGGPEKSRSEGDKRENTAQSGRKNDEKEDTGEPAKQERKKELPPGQKTLF